MATVAGNYEQTFEKLREAEVHLASCKNVEDISRVLTELRCVKLGASCLANDQVYRALGRLYDRLMQVARREPLVASAATSLRISWRDLMDEHCIPARGDAESSSSSENSGSNSSSTSSSSSSSNKPAKKKPRQEEQAELLSGFKEPAAFAGGLLRPSTAHLRSMPTPQRSANPAQGFAASILNAACASRSSQKQMQPSTSQTSIRKKLKSMAKTGKVSDDLTETTKSQKNCDKSSDNHGRRGSVRASLQQALCSGSIETRSPRSVCHLAKEVEEALWEEFSGCATSLIRAGQSADAAYVKQARSVIHNLRDQKNPGFRARLLSGAIDPSAVPKMTPETMASESKQAERAQMRKAAMEEVQSDWALKNGALSISGMFTCGKCKGTNTTYYQLQTRSSDEPMTTFVQCLSCGKRWKC